MSSLFPRFVASLLVGAAAFGSQPTPSSRPPWTTSAIKGTPEAPSPYRVERAFPALTFDRPLEVAVIPGTDRLVVVEQGGKLRSFRATDEGAGETDLFGEIARFDRELTDAYAITFHPKFAENRYAYLLAIAKKPGVTNHENGTRIIRFKVTPDPVPRLGSASGVVLITWLQGGHNGGNLRFGPDGMLYFGAGDAGPAEPPDPFVTGQDISDLLGSIMRIDVDRPDLRRPYGIPRDNPFVGVPKARGEVWAYGLRNPWRLAFDPTNGELYTGDVGWQLWEMVYRVQRGANFGWSITEGGRQDVRPDRVVGLAGIERLREKTRQPGTLIYRLGGYDIPSIDMNALQAKLVAARKSGVLKPTDINGSIAGFLGKGGESGNHIPGADSSTSETHTATNLLGREALLRMLRFLKEEPAFALMTIERLQPEAGIRETFRIIGETTLTHEDYTSGRVFEDAVAHSFYLIDLHYEGGVTPKHLNEGIVPTIPLRALIPKASKNLMVAGRCLSSDQLANSALRVQALCMAMGQAAGVTVALAAKAGTTPSQVPLADIRRELARHGAIVPRTG